MNFLFPSPLLMLSDEDLRRNIRQLRRRLGYWDFQDREYQLPPWLEKLLDRYSAESGDWEEFTRWLFERNGWIPLAALCLFLLLLLFFFSLRKIEGKRRMPGSAVLASESPSARILDRNRAEWMTLMEDFRRQGDYSQALVALYRASLTGLMDRFGMLEPLSNREISRMMEGAERACFINLYRRSDAFVFGEHPVDGETFHILCARYLEVFHEG